MLVDQPFIFQNKFRQLKTSFFQTVFAGRSSENYSSSQVPNTLEILLRFTEIGIYPSPAMQRTG